MSDLQELLREIAADISGAEAVGRLLQKNPKLFIEFRSVNWAGAVSEVTEGVADLGFAEVSAASTNSEIDIELVRNSQMFFFCAAGHPLAVKKKIAFGDLLEFPWAGPSLPGRIGSPSERRQAVRDC